MASTLYIQVADMEGKDLPVISSNEAFITAFTTAVKESETLVTESMLYFSCIGSTS